MVVLCSYFSGTIPVTVTGIGKMSSEYGRDTDIDQMLKDIL